MTPDHSSREFVELLDGIALAQDDGHPLVAAWRRAAAEAQDAYDAWHEVPCVDAYVVYLAAEDRADAAQDELANWMKLTAGLKPSEGLVTA